MMGLGMLQRLGVILPRLTIQQDKPEKEGNKETVQDKPGHPGNKQTVAKERQLEILLTQRDREGQLSPVDPKPVEIDNKTMTSKED